MNPKLDLDGAARIATAYIKKTPGNHYSTIQFERGAFDETNDTWALDFAVLKLAGQEWAFARVFVSDEASKVVAQLPLGPDRRPL